LRSFLGGACGFMRSFLSRPPLHELGSAEAAVAMRLVVAVLAGDIEAAHAVLAHVAQRHRLDRFVAWGCHLPTLRDHRRRVAISLLAGTLCSFATRSIASPSSAASTVPSHMALWAARYTSHDDSSGGSAGEGRFGMAAVSIARSELRAARPPA
jgi:hypothetical protein